MWYANADDIARFLAALNPYWDEATWQNLLQTQYFLEENFIWTLHNKGYADTIDQYDELYNSIEKIIDYMGDGITKQFG